MKKLVITQIFILAFIICIQSAKIYAEAVFDGTMNPATAGMTLEGNFEISVEHGKTAGNNLFHSFSTFNINADETATFTGPDTIRNVISRVTGGNISQIDGGLISDIPGANFYLLNPAGIMFGANAYLDIGGSFHVSTADYLKMENGEKFYVSSQDAVLSVSEPEAFGFLDDNIGNITINEGTYLETGVGNTFSLIGGDIEINSGTLMVPEGRINMVSAASACEVTPTDDGFADLEDIKRGKIMISDSLISTSWDGSGDIFIIGGELFMQDWSTIQTITQGDDPECHAGNIEIHARNVSFTSGAMIESGSTFAGKGGDVLIHAEENAEFLDSKIFSDTYSSEDAGDITIAAKNISFLDGSGLGSQTYGEGKGGNITLKASDTLTLSGTNEQGLASTITSYSYYEDSGNAGDILIEAKDVSFKDGGRINAGTEGSGDGGNITIRSTGEIGLNGVNPHGENIEGFSSRIASRSDGQEENAGKAGDIKIEAQSLSVANGAVITNSTSGAGESGVISVETNSLRISGDSSAILSEEPLESQIYFQEKNPLFEETTSVSGIYSRAESSEKYDNAGGEIHITADEMVLDNNGTVSSSTAGGRSAGNISLEIETLNLSSNGRISSESTASENAGNAGTIIVNASDAVKLSDSSAVTTEANGAGGGQIFVNAENEIYLLNSKITSSVNQGEGAGGDVKTESASVILNHGQIIANADFGDGGAVFIHTDNYMKSADSTVSATSKRGNDGTVKIEAPNTDITGSLVNLPENYTDAAKWLNAPCAARIGENISRFFIKGRDGIPNPLDDWLPGPLMRAEALK